MAANSSARPAAAAPALAGQRSGSGEPLVLLHGIGGSWREWEPVLPALERDFDVLALDLPGFGDSPPLGDATIPGQADVVEADLNVRGIHTAHLVGNSSGGWLALELARRGRARSVVALAPAGMWTRREDAYRYFLLRNAHYSAKLLARIPWTVQTPVGRWLLGWWMYMARPGRWSSEQAVDQVRKLGAAPSFMEFLRWTRGRRVEGLDEVACSVLVAWGSRDLLLPRRQAARFVRSIPNAEFRLLRGVGHVPMADDPQLVARTIREFAKRSQEAGQLSRERAP